MEKGFGRKNLAERIITPIVIVMFLVVLLLSMDGYFLHRTTRLYRGIALVETIPYHIEQVRFYQQQYLESRNDYVLGQFATAVNNLSVTFETLASGTSDPQTQQVAKQAIESTDKYQTEIFNLTDLFLELSKEIDRFEQEIRRGRNQVSVLVEQVINEDIPVVGKQQRLEGIVALLTLSRILDESQQVSSVSQWERLMLASDDFSVWAKKYGTDQLEERGNLIARSIGSILEKRNLISAKNRELTQQASSIGAIHSSFINDMKAAMNTCIHLANQQLAGNRQMIIAGLSFSLVAVGIMLWMVVFTVRRKLLIPIHRMIRAMKRIGRGSLDDRVPIPSTEELAELAISFNEMADALYESRQKLMIQRDNLEIAVEKRTKDLKTVNVALSRSNKELDDFTYIVSHDLKEPLRGISTFARFLYEEYKEQLDEEGQEYIDIINNASGRMRTLIEDLLELSRVTRRRNPRTDYNVTHALHEIVQDLDLLIHEKNAEVILPADDVVVQCDGIRIKQVFTNLINNALKFNKKERPQVQVSLPDKLPESASPSVASRSDMVLFAVSDNGIGIDPKYYHKVFEIFQRLVNREEFEGTGAGLTICKRIIEDHGGEIWLESVPDEGTTFFVALPRVAPPVEETSHQTITG